MSHIEVPVTKFNKILARLSDPEMIDLSAFDLLIYGSGAQSKSYYKDIQKNSGVEVLWTGWSGPPWTAFLSFIPGQAGLIRINDLKQLIPLYESLASRTVTDLYYIPQSKTPLLTEAVSTRVQNTLAMLVDEKEYVYLQAEQDDIIQDDVDCYYVYNYKLGSETAAVIRTVFVGWQ
jgi:hypothetical protein